MGPGEDGALEDTGNLPGRVRSADEGVAVVDFGDAPAEGMFGDVGSCAFDFGKLWHEIDTALKVVGCSADHPGMSAHPLRHADTSPAEPPGVAYLESSGANRPTGHIEELRREIATERSAGKAVLVTVLEMEGRLEAEREKGKALLATVRDLSREVEQERRAVAQQRLENQRLWGDIQDLELAVRAAERPRWRKLLRR